MNFDDERNIISIILSGLDSYMNHLSGKQFLFVYYDSDNDAYEFVETIFSNRHYKHLCGISSDKDDVAVYTKKGINKTTTSAMDFFKLCRKNRLGKKHIILKKDGTTIKKMNVLNNLYKITTGDTVYCKINKSKSRIKGDFIIGLESGDIAIAFNKQDDYCVPVSSLDLNIDKRRDGVFEIVLVASKNAYDKSCYKKVEMNKTNFDGLPQKITSLFDL